MRQKSNSTVSIVTFSILVNFLLLIRVGIGTNTIGNGSDPGKWIWMDPDPHHWPKLSIKTHISNPTECKFLLYFFDEQKLPASVSSKRIWWSSRRCIVCCTGWFGSKTQHLAAAGIQWPWKFYKSSVWTALFVIFYNIKSTIQKICWIFLLTLPRESMHCFHTGSYIYHFLTVP